MTDRRPSSSFSRRAGAAVLGIAAVPLLTGCSPEVAAVMGLTVDVDGTLVAVVQVCDGAYDFVAVSPETGPTDTATGWWEAPDSIDGLSLVRMAADGGWHQKEPLDVDRVPAFSIGAWDEGQSWGSVQLHVRTEDLDALTVGEVLTTRAGIWDDELSGKGNVSVPLTRFADQACASLRY